MIFKHLNIFLLNKNIQTKNQVCRAYMSLPVPFIKVLKKKKKNSAEAEPAGMSDRGRGGEQ